MGLSGMNQQEIVAQRAWDVLPCNGGRSFTKLLDRKPEALEP